MSKQFSTQEFEGLSREAFEHCFEFGASKISQFFTDGEKDILKNIEIVPSRYDSIIRILPSLGAIKDFILPHPEYCVISADTETTNERTLTEEVNAHIDSIAPVGLSFLAPTYGGNATFSASDQDFTLVGKTVFAGKLSYQVQYGLGDLMILRQKISEVEGRPTTYGQAYHVGVSPDSRGILTLDFKTEIIDFVS